MSQDSRLNRPLRLQFFGARDDLPFCGQQFVHNCMEYRKKSREEPPLRGGFRPQVRQLPVKELQSWKFFMGSSFYFSRVNRRSEVLDAFDESNFWCRTSDLRKL